MCLHTGNIITLKLHSIMLVMNGGRDTIIMTHSYLKNLRNNFTMMNPKESGTLYRTSLGICHHYLPPHHRMDTSLCPLIMSQQSLPTYHATPVKPNLKRSVLTVHRSHYKISKHSKQQSSLQVTTTYTGLHLPAETKVPHMSFHSTSTSTCTIIYTETQTPITIFFIIIHPRIRIILLSRITI